MGRTLTMKQRWQWFVAFVTVIVVVYVVFHRVAAIVAAALVLAFGLPALFRSGGRRRARR